MLDDQLNYVYEGIFLTRHKLNGLVPLFGFVGGPWTLMAYMVVGGGSRTYSKVKKWLYNWKSDAHAFLKALTGMIITHLINQANAGAQLL